MLIGAQHHRTQFWN